MSLMKQLDEQSLNFFCLFYKGIAQNDAINLSFVSTISLVLTRTISKNSKEALVPNCRLGERSINAANGGVLFGTFLGMGVNL